MSGRYAADTSIGTDRSKTEIERTLSRYGADEFIYGTKPGIAFVAFKMESRQVKMFLPLPSISEQRFQVTPSRGTQRSDSQIKAAWEQACRQAWRALALVIKAKLEAVESGISTFEREFLADIMLPNGSRVGDFMQPQIKLAYESGKMPELLPMLEARKK